VKLLHVFWPSGDKAAQALRHVEGARRVAGGSHLPVVGRRRHGMAWPRGQRAAALEG